MRAKKNPTSIALTLLCAPAVLVDRVATVVLVPVAIEGAGRAVAVAVGAAVVADAVRAGEAAGPVAATADLAGRQENGGCASAQPCVLSPFHGIGIFGWKPLRLTTAAGRSRHGITPLTFFFALSGARPGWPSASWSKTFLRCGEPACGWSSPSPSCWCPSSLRVSRFSAAHARSA